MDIDQVLCFCFIALLRYYTDRSLAFSTIIDIEHEIFQWYILYNCVTPVAYGHGKRDVFLLYLYTRRSSEFNNIRLQNKIY